MSSVHSARAHVLIRLWVYAYIWHTGHEHCEYIRWSGWTTQIPIENFSLKKIHLEFSRKYSIHIRLLILSLNLNLAKRNENSGCSNILKSTKTNAQNNETIFLKMFYTVLVRLNAIAPDHSSSNKIINKHILDSMVIYFAAFGNDVKTSVTFDIERKSSIFC